MNKQYFDNLNNLATHLKNIIKHTKEQIAIIGGHHALDNHLSSGINLESKASFGIFPQYTMDLACQLINFGKDIEKDIKLTLLVDDYSFMSDRLWYMHEDNTAQTIRHNLENYFTNYQLPQEYQEIMTKYSLTENDIISSNHSLAFQESLYRQQFAQQTGLPPGCSGEYRLILEELAQKGIKKVIGFIPLRCQGPTCNAIGQYNAQKTNPRIKYTHIYLSSNSENETKEELLNEMNEDYGGIIIIEGN